MATRSCPSKSSVRSRPPPISGSCRWVPGVRIAALLAMLVIFLFLRSVRATLVTAVSLPTSVLVALLGTNLGGFALNSLTLAGLTIAVGRIIDDAIVVLENSYRHLQQGRTPVEAAYRGATEVSSAVISSTLTTVGVFLPIGL